MPDKKPVDNELPQLERESDELVALRAQVDSLLEELSRLRQSQSVGSLYDDESGSRRRSESTSSRRSGRRSTRVSTRSRDFSDDIDDRPSEKRTSDSFRDLSDRAIDEASKMARGITLSYIEGLRTAADALTTFVDEVSDRNRPEDEDSVRDLVTKLPGDIYSGYIDALDRSLDLPSNTITKFNDTYNESSDVEQDDLERNDNVSRSRSSRSSRRSERSDRSDRGEHGDRGGKYQASLTATATKA